MAIQEALLEVPLQRRECLVLHYVEGLKYREIAGVVDATEEAVRKRVSRGSKEFREAYRRLSGDVPE
jgi:RNA polymerase sigma factor (sigma-70 family)